MLSLGMKVGGKEEATIQIATDAVEEYLNGLTEKHGRIFCDLVKVLDSVNVLGKAQGTSAVALMLAATAFSDLCVTLGQNSSLVVEAAAGLGPFVRQKLAAAGFNGPTFQ